MNNNSFYFKIYLPRILNMYSLLIYLYLHIILNIRFIYNFMLLLNAGALLCSLFSTQSDILSNRGYIFIVS